MHEQAIDGNSWKADARSAARRLARGPGLPLLLLLALLPRLAWLLSFDWLPVNDAAWFQQSALDLAHGLGYVTSGRPTAYFPVGYSGFLAGLFLVFPAGSMTVGLANAALGAALVLISIPLFRELGLSDAAARWSALLIALCPTLVLYTSLEASETLFTFLLAGATWLLLVARRALWTALAAGLVFGAATLVRSQVVLLPLAMLALLVVMRAVPLGRAARIGIALYLLLACVVAPWTLRNWIVLGTPALVSTNDGANLLLGNHPDTRWGSGYPVTEGKAADLEDVLYSEWRTPTDEAAWDRRVRARALAYIAADPLHYLLLWPRKIRRQFDPDAFAYDVNQEQAASAGQDIGFLRPLLQPLRDLFHEAQIGLVLLGLALAVRQRAIRLPILFCALPAAYFAALSCVFFAEPRFNFPAIPFLIGGAVCALAVLASALVGRLQTAPAPTACS